MCTNQNIHYLDSGITWLGPICITVSTLREYQTHSRSCRRYSSPSYPSRSRSSAFTSVRPPPGLTVSGKENWPTFTFCTLYGNARLPTNSPPHTGNSSLRTTPPSSRPTRTYPSSYVRPVASKHVRLHGMVCVCV